MQHTLSAPSPPQPSLSGLLTLWVTGHGEFLVCFKRALACSKSASSCRFRECQSLILANRLPHSLIPESPRWLISRDRHEEAYNVLVKYHAEGDADSLLIKAEMAQIRSTIELEMKLAKQSWLDMVRMPGMRRRVLIAAMIGLFGQMSGNTLLSYYSNLLFQTMGYTTSYGKTRINLANQCWSLLVGVTAALLVARFPRRIMVSCTPVLLH